MKRVISSPKERLKLLCSKLDLTQKELAQKAKLRESSISNYISGYRTPNLTAICKIAEAANCSTDWLIGYGGDDDFNTEFDRKLLLAYAMADVEIQEAISTLLNLEDNTGI